MVLAVSINKSDLFAYNSLGLAAKICKLNIFCKVNTFSEVNTDHFQMSLFLFMTKKKTDFTNSVTKFISVIIFGILGPYNQC